MDYNAPHLAIFIGVKLFEEPRNLAWRRTRHDDASHNGLALMMTMGLYDIVYNTNPVQENSFITLCVSMLLLDLVLFLLIGLILIALVLT